MKPLKEEVVAAIRLLRGHIEQKHFEAAIKEIQKYDPAFRSFEIKEENKLSKELADRLARIACQYIPLVYRNLWRGVDVLLDPRAALMAGGFGSWEFDNEGRLVCRTQNLKELIEKFGK